MEEQAERRVRAVEDRLNATIMDYEARLQKLQSDVNNMEGAIDNQSNAMKRKQLFLTLKLLVPTIDAKRHL